MKSGVGCRASATMAKASESDEATVKSIRSVRRGTGSGTKSTDRQSKVGTLSWTWLVQDKARRLINKSAGIRERRS